jgi:MoaA/NifB/PqqE/SkfB family radical SAM enzyme
VVQITDRCNARCPQCGMRVTESFARSTLETDAIKRMIDAAACRGVQAISFTGGEPLLDLPRLVELIRYAGGAGIPFIRTGTNGFMLTNPEKKGFEDRVSRMVEQLADSPLRNFWISLDSAVDHVHDAMRGFPGVVAGIAKALPIFHQAGIYPAVNLGINRNVGGDGYPHCCIGKNSAPTGPIWTWFYSRYERPLIGFTSGRSIWDSPWPTPAIP